LSKLIEVFEMSENFLPAKNLYGIPFGNQYRILVPFDKECASQVFAPGFNFDSLIGTTNKCWFNVWLVTMAAVGIRLSLADSEAIKAFVESTGDRIGMPSDVVWSDAVIHAFRAAKILPYLYDDRLDAGTPLMPATPGAKRVFFRNQSDGDGGHWTVALPNDSSLVARFAALAESGPASIPVARSPVSQPAPATSLEAKQAASLKASVASAPAVGMLDATSRRKKLIALRLELQKLQDEVTYTEQRIARGKAEINNLTVKDLESICALTEVLDEHSRRLDRLKSALKVRLVEQAAQQALKVPACSPVSQLAPARSPVSQPAPARSPVSQLSPARTPEARQEASRKAAEEAEEEAFQAALKASADEAASLAAVELFQAEELARAMQIESDAAFAMTL